MTRWLCAISAAGLLLHAPPARADDEPVKETPLAGAGQGVAAKASATYFQKSDTGGRPSWSTPAWTIKLEISNYTAGRAELGGLLAVIQEAEGRDDYASSYIALHRKDEAAMKMVEGRYALLWGVNVEREYGIWPLAAASSGLSNVDTFTLLLSSPSETNTGLVGFGGVSPRSMREISKDVLFPVVLRVPTKRVVVVPPSYRLPSGAVEQQVFSFDVAGIDMTQQPFQPKPLAEPTARSIARTVPALTALLEAEAEPLWLRVFALNWLAETDLAAAEPHLLRLAAGAKPALQQAAVSNLGAWKIKAAVQPLIGLAGASDGLLKARTIEALGEIGDPAAIPTVRAQLGDKTLGRVAMEAVGKLKDDGSVPLLLAEVKKGGDEAVPASMSLVAIGSDSAADGLAAMAADPKAKRFARIRALVGLRELATPKALPAAIAAASDKKADNGVQQQAVQLLVVLMKAGNEEARAYLTTYAEQPKAPGRYDARQALGLPN